MLSIVCFGAAAILAVLSVTRHRHLIICGFYCFFVLLTVLGEFVVPHLGPLTIYRALYLILGLSILFRWMQDRTFTAQIRRLPLLPFIALVVLVFASSLYSVFGDSLSWENNWNVWNHAVTMLVFLLTAFHIQRETDLNDFAATTVVVSVVLAFWVVRNIAQLNFEAYRGGISNDQNYVSGFIFLGMLVLIDVVLKGRSRLRLLWIPVLLGELFTSLNLASRGMFIAFAMGALYLLISYLRGRHRWAVVGILTVLALVVGIALLLPGSELLFSRFQDADVSTLSYRMTIWKGSLALFADSGPLRMLFGQGLYSAPVVIGPIVPDLLNYHNEFIRWLMDAGLIGLGAITVFFYTIGRRTLTTTHPLKRLMMSWFIFFLVTGLSENLSDVQITWLFMGLIASCSSFAPESGYVPRTASEYSAPIAPNISAVPYTPRGL